MVTKIFKIMMHSSRKKLGRKDNYAQDYIEQAYLLSSSRELTSDGVKNALSGAALSNIYHVHILPVIFRHILSHIFTNCLI